MRIGGVLGLIVVMCATLAAAQHGDAVRLALDTSEADEALRILHQEA
ncbi:MAG TPA: hypothetical protein VGL89_07575 [Candidatus Koribacter sp.]|jgi:hypothetical protein